MSKRFFRVFFSWLTAWPWRLSFGRALWRGRAKGADRARVNRAEARRLGDPSPVANSMASRLNPLGRRGREAANAQDDRIIFALPRDEIVSALNQTLRQSGPTTDATGYSDHPDLIKSLADSAYLCECQGRYGEAERLYRQSLTLSVRRYGDSHFALVTGLEDLATFYHKQARYAEAEPLCRQLLKVRSQHQPPCHPDIGEALFLLAEAYRHQSRYSKAEPLLQKAVGVFTEACGADSPRTQAVKITWMQLISEMIAAGKCDLPKDQLEGLDLERLSEVCSWAKPDWLNPESDDTYSWVLSGWGKEKP
ncbi:MAG: tetratricopeptide repeat protein [Cyanobacteria bacterium J06623_4]